MRNSVLYLFDEKLKTKQKRQFVFLNFFWIAFDSLKLFPKTKNEKTKKKYIKTFPIVSSLALYFID